MAAPPDDATLREAAKARGFRLVKSRRRKPGGDFGRYGLQDASGRECFGFGPDGLTATAEEVLAYLRGGEVASWKRSLIGVVGEAEATSKSTHPEQGGGASARTRSPGEPPQPKIKRKTPASDPAPKHERPSTSLGTGKEGESARAPVAIREATRRDAAAIARLIDVPAAPLADRLGGALHAEEAPLVAERDGLLGIIAWTSIATLQNGTRARITLLHVADSARRQGIATRLLAEAEQRLRDAGIEQVELALAIDLDAPTALLRRTGFERKTNGYGKKLGG
jgi:ribosomal protein S18 acetylase RimI-like enzyme